MLKKHFPLIKFLGPRHLLNSKIRKNIKFGITNSFVFTHFLIESASNQLTGQAQTTSFIDPKIAVGGFKLKRPPMKESEIELIMV